jgi:hypothetical protein
MIAVALAVSGCGGDDEQSSSAPATTAPADTTTTETEATPTEMEQEPPSTESVPTGSTPEDQPGGAGDEQETRVPIELTLDNGGITPPQVAVPGFLALELIVHNKLPVEVVVRLEGAKPIAVGPGDTGRARLAGRRPGRYVIDAGVAGKAVLITGVDPGP